MTDPDLAGAYMTFREDENGTAFFAFDDKGTGRKCGSCQLCCKLVPVPPIRKAAGKRCVHAKVGKGCGIYPTRPFACRSWSCRWLADPRTAGMPRPDRCHYVIDLEYDYITQRYPDREVQWQALQVWVDPAFPDAHRAPELRAYMAMIAEEYRIVTIVRYNSRRAITVVAPCLNVERQWLEITDHVIEARTPEEQAILRDWKVEVG